MPITVTCAGCNATLRAPDTAAGKHIKCPKCQNLIQVPNAAVTVPPPVPLPMASAAPALASTAPSHADHDDRPRRRRDWGDDDDDRPRRRRSSEGGENTSSGSNGVSIGLGIGAIALGLLAGVFAFVPCCGSFVAWPAGGIGLLLGAIGVLMCVLAKQKNVAAMILTIAGTLLNGAAIAISLIWFVYFSAMATHTVNQASKMAEEAQRQQKEWQEQQKKLNQSQNPANDEEKKTTKNNLRQIGLAFQNYQDVYKSLPPPNPKGSTGPLKGALSWRVAILPFIEQQNLYSKFKLDEDWNSPHNMKVFQSNEMPKIYAAPRLKPFEERKTYYQVFTGLNTLFPTANARVALGGQQRGSSSLWLLAEARNPVEWTRPDDIAINFNPASQLGGIFDGDYHVLCLDASVHYVRKNAFPNPSIQMFTNPNVNLPVVGWPPPP